jgi:hypothetical protein
MSPGKLSFTHFRELPEEREQIKISSSGLSCLLKGAGRIGIYFVNTKRPENWPVEEQLAGKTLDKTQFGHIAETLGCELIPAERPPVRKPIVFLFNEKTGFKAYYDKQYYEVKCPEFLNKDKPHNFLL